MKGFREDFRELAPHYVVLIVLLFGVLLLVEQFMPELHFIGRILIAFAVAVAYPLVLRQFDMAPGPWE